MHWGITRNQNSHRYFHLAIFFSLILIVLPTNSMAGLENPGFESGVLEPYWITIPPADVATVVDSEGAADFQSYADQGITVDPKAGDYMLRLGSPKQISEKQNRGDNIVYQTFSSTEETLSFAARIFSWEHRGDDMVRISLKDSNGNDINVSVTGENGSALTLDLGPGQPASCENDTLPCEFVIDAGKSGDFINTGWVVFELSGLPTDGTDVTLEFALVGGQNEAHATWMYVDNVNSPPIAVFEVSDTDTIEGNVVKLIDKSYDPDAPDDYIAKRTWTIYDPNCDCTTTSIDKQEIVIVAANDGILDVTLTVEDSFGATDTVTSNSTARDDTQIPEVSYVDHKVLMNVLNQEVLVGGKTELVGRYVDAGYDDTHIAVWRVNAGWISNEVIQEDHAPFIGIGMATATYTAPDTAGTYDAWLDIKDASDNTIVVTKHFTIDVLDAPYSRENNNDTQTAKPLATSGVYLTTLDNPGDVDIFELVQEDVDGSLIPIEPGSEIMVKLKGLPADYDLIILRENPEADVGASPVDWFNFGQTPIDWFNFGQTPIDWFNFGQTPIDWFNFGQTPVDWFNFGQTPIDWFNFGQTPVRSIWLRNPLVNPFESPDLAFNQFPISEVYMDTPNNRDLTKMDVGLSELGLADLEGSGLAIVDYSTNRGLDPENLLVRTGNTDVKIYIAIVGNNGAFDPNNPASVQIESSVPMKVETLVGDKCYKSPLVKTNVTSLSTKLHGTGSTTLFVTQRERYIEIHGLDGWNTFKEELNNLADDVDGTVISLPSSIYDNWDSNPCNVELANSVATAIRQEILGLKTDDTQYVVFVGNDLIIPHYRSPDATSFSNERLYANESLLLPDSALYASLFSGYSLTDDYYADDNPDIDNRSVLYIPRFSLARLLETPNEILNVITRFRDSGGSLNLNTALVAGYDFFKDAAKDIEAKLSLIEMPVTSLINETEDPSNDWSADQLLCELLGDAYAANCTSHDFNNFNAHFSHFLAESALGFSSGEGDYFFTGEISEAASNIKTLSNTINTTVGCHAGFNAPDGLATDFGPDSPLNPNLDFPQVMARQGGVFVASTGYGIAGRNSIAATELLLSLYTEELLKGATAGLALVNAKQRFYTEQSDITIYDQKAAIQTTFYGLPMYTVNLPSNTQNTSPAITGTPYRNITLSLIDQGQTSSYPYQLERIVKDDGTFFVINGNHQATAARPIQPKITRIMSGNNQVHGVLIQDANFIIADDIANFDPVYSRPTTELERNATEKSFCQDAYWPSEIVKVNSIRSLNQSTLVVIPAQFRCTSGDASIATGIERIYDSLTLEVLRSTSTDFTKPVIKEVDLRDTQNGTTSITVHASDDQSDINQIVVLLINDDGTVTQKDSGQLSGNGSFTFDLEVSIDTTRILVQVADGAGNVATWTGKGANVRKINVDAGTSKVYSTFFDTTFTATVYGFNDLLTDAEHIYYRWDFGDNNSESYKVGNLAENGQKTPIVTVDQQGNATFTVSHRFTDDTSTLATLKITDSAGGIGVDDVVLQACGDAADLQDYPDGDLVGCGISNDGSVVTVSLKVARNITNEFQYRMYFDIEGTAKNSLPDGKSDLTIKWDNDNVTTSGGLNLLSTSKSTDRITVSFDLADLKFRGNHLQWKAETQSGIQAAQGVGFADQMPNDDNWFGYDLQ